MIEDIMSRIELPIYTAEGLKACVDDCLSENRKGDKGLNIEHRNIKLTSYREPKKTRPINENDKNVFMCQIIRYVAKSLYLEFSALVDSPLKDEELILNVAPEFITKNPELKDMRIKDLSKIMSMPNEQLLTHLSRGWTKIDAFIKKTYDSFNLWQGDSLKPSEHVCANPIYEHLSPSPDDIGVHHGGVTLYSKRIYINGSQDKKELDFILEVLKKCIDKRIPCDMKPMFSRGLDGTIYYSSNENFEELLNVLEEVIKEHPELLDCLGTPIISGANVKSYDGNCYYAICHGGGKQDIYWGGTYNDVVDRIINTTYDYSCLNLISYYWPVVYKECSKEVSNLRSLKITSREEMRMLYSCDKEIRTLAFKIVNDALANNNPEPYQRLLYFFSQTLGIITSLNNFNDLNHCDVPMYKDESFLQFEELIANNQKARV